MAPTRRGDISAVAFRAFIAGILIKLKVLSIVIYCLMIYQNEGFIFFILIL